MGNLNNRYKFRAWTDNLKDGGEMYYQFPSEHLSPLFSPAGYGLLNPSLKLMQYTGLKDKNGVEIYEGDILQVPVKDGNKYKIVFNDGGFTVVNLDSASARPASNDYLKVYAAQEEVIGNIYQNPELLK